MVTGVFIAVAAVSSQRTAEEFSALTVTVTVAWFDTAPSSSATVYVNVSVPV